MTDSVQSIINWQKLARPTVTEKGKLVALGVWVEEIAEGFDAIGAPEIAVALDTLATALKTGKADDNNIELTDFKIDRQALLDALCDQIVTALGVAYCMDLDIVEAMKRVDDSNWSKFVDGAPILDGNGKVMKGPDYKAPDLEGLY